MGFVPLEGEPPVNDPEVTWFVYALKPWDLQAKRPTKPYLVEADDYENAREKAATLVNVEGI